MTDENGTEVQRMEIPKSSDPIEWAGTSPDGTPLPSGIYQFNVVSYSNGEVVLDEPSDVYARVNEVRSENGQSILILEGGIAVNAAQVTALKQG